MKALILAFILASPQASVTGRWQWEGQAGWQKIALDLQADGSRLRGTIRMGPGVDEPATRAEFWEYFFDPAAFEILAGRINGNSISFEQEVHINGERSRFLYTGIIERDSIALTRELLPNPKAKPILGAHRAQFTVRRAR